MITGVVLARNEESNIAACLAALRPHVQELLLIDMESADRTVERARPYIDRVLTHPQVANFDAARNIAIPAARFDWLWFIDADERVSDRTGRLVNDLVRERGDSFEALTIPFKTHFCGRWIQHCGWWPGYTMPRVLKRGHFQFATRLHGGVECKGRNLYFPPDPELGIEHFSYLSVAHYLDKFNRYTSTESQQLANAGAEFDWQAGLREMTRDLWMYYERNRGDLDGPHGWVLSWLSGQYRWATQAKLLDSTNAQRLAQAPVPRDLNEVLSVMQDELARCRRHAPELPLGIVWRSPIWDPSGYAEEGRSWLKTLAGGSRELVADELRWSDRLCEPAAADAALLRALQRGQRPHCAAAITNCIPTLCAPDDRAALNILRTTFETDRIPGYWLPHLEQFDEIWVMAQHNRVAFTRSGVPPEKIRVVPSCVDTDLYTADGPRLKLPQELADRFVFLSVFDWQLRKGWNALVRAFCQEFRPWSDVGLLLKITTSHGHSLDLVQDQLRTLLEELGETPEDRPEIVLWEETLSALQIAALYRAVNAFVLASRGEGCGRPYMEAMATGLPTIGTRGSGNEEFMNEANSFLVATAEVEVPEEAAREIPPYQGHRWREPDIAELQGAMRRVYNDPVERHQRSQQARQDIQQLYSLPVGRQYLESCLEAAEERFRVVESPAVQPGQLRVALQGEFFAGHSFSHVNEQIAKRLCGDSTIALSIDRLQYQPIHAEASSDSQQLSPLMQRRFADGPDVTIRHAFPPRFDRPASGRWVHIQPWEFGYLPEDWVQPLRDCADEIWVPSHYVRQVYERSQIPADKIYVIPYGVDSQTFHPNAPPLFLPTDKTFAFLFVGGTIERKGFDILLSAFLAEFQAEEDVCLVVKDLGTTSFYRYGNHRQQALAAASDVSGPKVIYLENHLTPGQLASLYTACHCLAAPYRGEGFGLPILEAMACGLPAIVTQGGPSDDFCTPETAYLLPSREVACQHDWPLCGQPSQLEVDVVDVRKAMRAAFSNREQSRVMGEAAARSVRDSYSWEQSVGRMRERLSALQDLSAKRPLTLEDGRARVDKPQITITAGLCTQNHEELLPACLASARPFVDEVIVFDQGSVDRTCSIAEEYGAKVLKSPTATNQDELREAIRAESHSDWILWLSPESFLPPSFATRLRKLLAETSADTMELTLPMDDRDPLTTARLERREAPAESLLTATVDSEAEQ